MDDGARKAVEMLQNTGRRMGVKVAQPRLVPVTSNRRMLNGLDYLQAIDQNVEPVSFLKHSSTIETVLTFIKYRWRNSVRETRPRV
jgi:hypothetical protein